MTATGAPRQLSLSLGHHPEYGRDSFVAAPSNEAALALIERWPNWPAPVAVLSGPAGAGKTHLAYVWADLAGASIVEARTLGPDAAAKLAGGARLAAENVDPDRVPEQALFHLVNAATENGGGLLLTSRAASADWQVALPDLRSRLRMAAPAHLAAPDDDLLRKVLVKLFADRQIDVDRPVIDYLLRRMERSLAAAAALVGSLDREALAAGRPINRAMAGEALAAMAAAEAAFPDRQ